MPTPPADARPDPTKLSPDARVAELLGLYSASDACLASLLCDGHSPDQLAYRIIGSDLVGQEITYAELKQDSERFAAALSRIGIVPGDRVGTLMGKSREYLVTLLGIWRLGAVHVPLFTAFAPAAIALRLDASDAKAVVCDEAQLHKLTMADCPAEVARQVITTGAAVSGIHNFDDLIAGEKLGFPAAVMGGDAPFIHIYTSGTTGNPKGVVVPISALAAFRIYAEYGQGVQPDDTFWCAADPGWAYGLYFGILATFTTGTRSILLKAGFTPEATLHILEHERVSNFAAAPTVYRALRSSGLTPASPLAALRCASSAGEPLTPEVNIWAKDVLGLDVYDHYGQTEAGMLINNHHHHAIERPIRPGSMGQAMPGWTATILHAERDEEVGADTFGRVAMVVCQSPLLWFGGYDGDPTKTAGKITDDGRYYLTGDTGMVDQDGYYRFSARDDDVIIMAGYRIGPFEIESSMSTHPAVAEAAVIAVPDEVRGEVVEAYVVLAEGYEGTAEMAREVQQWVKTNYAAHAYPRTVHFIDAMPKTPSGKIQRFVLKQKRLEELAR